MIDLEKLDALLDGKAVRYLNEIFEDYYFQHIVIAGIDGSGKGTLCRKLVSAMEQVLFREVVQYDFPQYHTHYGEMIGKYLNGVYGDLDPQITSLLYANDRLMVREKMQEDISLGRLIVCNRYVESNIAFQSARLRMRLEDQGVPKDEIEDQLEEFRKWILKTEHEINKMPKENNTILVSLSPSTAQKRVSKKGERDYTNKLQDKHEADIKLLDYASQEYRLQSKRNAWIEVSSENLDEDEILAQVIKEMYSILL